jgi:hypothetical protein
MFRRVRAMGLFLRLGFVAATGAAAASCTLISGLEPYTVGAGGADGDSGVPATASNSTPETSMSSSGKPTEDPDATVDPDASPITGEVNEAGGSGDAKSPTADATMDGGDAHPDDGADGGPMADASDGAPPHDSGEAGEVEAGGCTQVTHSNGVDGGTFVDCVPLDSHNQTQAQEACAAAKVGSCGKNTILCSPFGGGDIECTNSASPCICWNYSGPGAGHVSVSQAGALCACPLTSDPKWR